MKNALAFNRLAGGSSPFTYLPAVRKAPRTFWVVSLMVVLPLFFSVGRYIPASKWSLEIAILMSVGAAILSTAGGRAPMRHPFNVYIMLTAFGLPIMGALAAYVVFGQPMIYGLAAQRGCLLALFAYAIGNMIFNGRVTLAELQRAFIILAWFNLAVCAPVLILLDPNNYSELGALVSDGGGIYNEFHLPMTFILLGAMYYVSMWMLSDRPRYGLFAAPFILYIVAGANGRILNLALAVTLLVIAWIGSPRKRLKNLSAALALAIAVVIGIAIVNPDKIGSTVIKYQDAFAAVAGAYDVADVSANARIVQTEVAWPYIYDNPITGTGALSNEWNGGYQQLFGYFHPSDLGMIGVMFVYGLIGVAFFSFQYIAFARLSPVVKHMSDKVPYNALLLAMFANLLFMLFSSIVTGSFILVPEQTLFFFAVILAQVRLNSVVITPQ